MKGLKKTIRVVLTGIALAALVCTTSMFTPACMAQEPFIYPAKGQGAEQVDKDKYECYQWARQQTGYDPMQRSVAQTPAPQKRGGALKGAAGGALMGAAVGAIAGDAGKGAAIGATSGGIIGGVRRHRSRQEQEQWAQREQASYEQQRGQYNRAWGACMEGRDYVVK